MKPRSKKQQERIREYLLESEEGNCINNGILNDKEIKKLAEKEDMIKPFVDHQVEKGVISYGLSSFGFDIRAGNKFKIFTDIDSAIVDPKNFNNDSFVDKESDDSVIIPPNSFALLYSVEKFNMPEDVMGIIYNKSSWARCGLIVNTSIIEPAFRGTVTLELSNTTPLPAKVYPNEGIAQVVFFRGKRPNKTYDERNGKYQNQGNKPEPAKVI